MLKPDKADGAARARKALGKRLERARKRAKLSQSELARRVGCARWSISRFERGERDASPYAKQLAAALGVKAAALTS